MTRHAVVTGGGSGAGAEIANQLSAAGYAVTIMGRTEQSLVAQGHPYELCDVTDPQAVATAFAAARNERGPIEIVIANAGVAVSEPFSRMKPQAFEQMLGVNLIGVANVWQAALADMQSAGWGRMIAIASTAGLKGYPYVSAYVASKHAVVGLTKALALELATSGVTVNAICPGFMETPLLDRSISRIVETTGMSEEQAIKTLKAGNPQRRFIQTEEVAAAVLYLCSQASGSINGHSLSLSGGEI